MNAKIRQSLYALGTVGTGLLTLLVTWRGIDAGTATALTNVITTLCGLLGVGAAGTAAVITGRQRKDGTLEVSPADQVINGVQAVIEAKSAAEVEVRRIQDAVGDLVATIPGLGPLASQVLQHIPKF